MPAGSSSPFGGVRELLAQLLGGRTAKKVVQAACHAIDDGELDEEEFRLPARPQGSTNDNCSMDLGRSRTVP